MPIKYRAPAQKGWHFTNDTLATHFLFVLIGKVAFSGEESYHHPRCQATKEKEPSREATEEKKASAEELEQHTWIDQVLVNGANGEFVPINIEDIAQVVEVDDEGTHQTFLKESSLDPLLGEKAMEVNKASSKSEVTGGIQLAEEAVLFESLMENIGLGQASSVSQATSNTTTNTTSADGPHPISTETITLHYPIETMSLNPSTLFDNELDECISDEHLICPHRAVETLPTIKFNEKAKDQVSSIHV